jgi:hypothetical protein
MSGIIAPSIVNYDWTVKVNDPSYLNVSFPFRVKIEKIWFTTQQVYGPTAGLWQGVEQTVDIETTERLLRLAAIKSKNSKTQHNAIDNPSDWMFAFENVPWDGDVNEELKPTMWLGNPDDAAGRIGAFGTQTNWGNGALDLRSTAATPIDKAHAINYSWDTFNEWIAKTYLTDVAVMNTDEILQMFVYNDGGNWAGYEEDAKVTISVAYTGISNETAVSAPAKPWTAWWND